MNFFAKLFGQKGSSKKGEAQKVFSEKDNLGTNMDTLSLANSFWMSTMNTTGKMPPHLAYTFDTEKDGKEALLELPCMHLTESTKKIICTKTLTFGCYQTENRDYEAFIYGDELNHELWKAAKDSFVNRKGKKYRELEPEKSDSAPQPQEKKVEKEKVTFIREEREQKMGQTMTYRIHKAPNEESAKAFLQENPVTKQFHYLVIKTPEGNYCRDLQGIYKE